MMTIDVKTSVYPNGMIVSELVDDIGTSFEKVMRTVMDTREQHIREGLIKLGWTPPANSRDSDT